MKGRGESVTVPNKFPKQAKGNWPSCWAQSPLQQPFPSTLNLLLHMWIVYLELIFIQNWRTAICRCVKYKITWRNMALHLLQTEKLSPEWWRRSRGRGRKKIEKKEKEIKKKWKNKKKKKGKEKEKNRKENWGRDIPEVYLILC